MFNGTTEQSHLWKLLWDYDPNGLIVVDPDLYIKVVNPALCTLFRVEPEDVIGQPLNVLLEDGEDFRSVWQHNHTIRGQVKDYPQHHLSVSQTIFAIEEEGLIVGILVDISHELERRREFEQLKRATIQQVNEVVDNQMKVVQEIAGLLGETTAETKVSLLKIIQILEHNML